MSKIVAVALGCALLGSTLFAAQTQSPASSKKIEALFKAFARALRVACSRDRRLGRMLPSTKGIL